MTLAEMILALLLLSLLILSVLAVFTTFLSSSAKSGDQAIGVLFADQVLEQATSKAQKTYPAFAPSLNGGQGFYTQDPVSQTTFFYTVTASELTPASNANATSAGQNWMLETQVYWWSAAQSTSRTGYGNLSVKRARMVYVSR